MFPSLDFLLKKGVGSRIMVILESFPFFMTGKLVDVDPDTVAVEAQEGVPIQLVGHTFHISQASIAAFFIEEKGFPIPRLEPTGDDHIRKADHDSDLVEEVKEVLSRAVGEIKEMLGEAVKKAQEMPDEPAREMEGDVHQAESSMTDAERKYVGQDVLLVLRPRQLSILGQVFRPIIVAKLEKVGPDFVFLKDVNIRFSNAPDFVFPLPLVVPKRQIALFLPFERHMQFPLV